MMENSFPRRDGCRGNRGEPGGPCGLPQELQLAFILVICRQGREGGRQRNAGLLASHPPWGSPRWERQADCARHAEPIARLTPLNPNNPRGHMLVAA